ncbi:hypothetical protein [Pseudomonas serbica]|jgi:hypothetical protein|uniref:hypothetical protein n=1 Tax=Pseudomonas serbica TaxID=2965074 RepID=UPI00237B1F28|nr:hypothetical protein [Pseudomonas serbica]
MSRISEVLPMTSQEADNILAALMPWAIESLEQAMARYLHLCGASVCTADPVVLEQDKLKYPHMVLRDNDGDPYLSVDDCVDFLCDVTGLTAEKSLAYQKRVFLKLYKEAITRR